MKLTTGINILRNINVDTNISKKILLANTSGKLMSPEALKKSRAISNDPLYQDDKNSLYFNPDIRYRNYFAFSPLANIDYRNALLMFAENKEIKKAVKIMANEVVVIDSDNYKYPVYPDLNLTMVDNDKQKVGQAIVEYLNQVFWPKLWQMLSFKKDGLNNMIKDFLVTGKIAYEIIYDNLKNPKEIIGMMPIDATTLQKFKEGDNIFYVQKSTFDCGERVLHENQIVLLEWNKYDFGYVSYVDGLRMSFNIMRSMQTSKILWFATKSQVRMHIKLALGEVSREEAIQKLSEMRNNYTNSFTFGDDGVVKFNSRPNNSGYREFFTADTAQGGSPEIEEINANGPDLTEVESLQYWERLFWNDTTIPYDRIDPNSTDNWGFLDAESVKKIEVMFAKDIESIRQMIEDVFLKPLIIQLTLKEVEIGIDLTLLDSLKVKWVSYNQYEKMADLEIMEKKLGVASTLKDYGTMTNAAGTEISTFPLSWINRNYLDINEDMSKLIEEERKREWLMLGYDEEGKPKPEFVDAAMGSMGNIEQDIDMDMKEDLGVYEDDGFEESGENIEELENNDLDDIDAEIAEELKNENFN